MLVYLKCRSRQCTILTYYIGILLKDCELNAWDFRREKDSGKNTRKPCADDSHPKFSRLIYVSVHKLDWEIFVYGLWRGEE